MGADSTRAPEGATTLTIKETWRAAYAAWEAAKLAFDLIDAANATAREEAKGTPSPALDSMDRETDRLGHVECDKRNSLIRTPAPDFGAVSQKLQLLFAPEYGELGPDDQYISAYHRSLTDAVIADMARLQSEFAEAWIAKWTADGGSLAMGFDGHVQLGFPTYELSPRYVAPAEHMGEEFAHDFEQTNAQHYHSTMNARVDSLKIVPGGSEILKAYMRDKGLRSITNQTEQGQ